VIEKKASSKNYDRIEVYLPGIEKPFVMYAVYNFGKISIGEPDSLNRNSWPSIASALCRLYGVEYVEIFADEDFATFTNEGKEVIQGRVYFYNGNIKKRLCLCQNYDGIMESLKEVIEEFPVNKVMLCIKKNKNQVQSVIYNNELEEIETFEISEYPDIIEDENFLVEKLSS